jgi:signal transduction histidine kinase
MIAGLIVVLVIIQVIAFILLYIGSQTSATQSTISPWFPTLLITTAILLALYVLIIYYLNQGRTALGLELTQAYGKELRSLRAANDRAVSLQAMASTLSATLSFERVVEQSLDVCSLALEEMGIPRESLVGAVFLYEDGSLKPLARRRFLGTDEEKVLNGREGVVGAALQQAELTVTNNPLTDPELKEFAAFRKCLTAVCVPLRAGFQLFGAMVIGTETAVQFDDDHFDLFRAVADQAVIALQNAQLYQRLETEKQRLIEADEVARRELARDLHDGPTQRIATVAMRLSFIRNMIDQDPIRAKEELRKVETLTKETSAEVRDMLFTLRPLVLETQGLGVAVESLLKRYRDTSGINMQLTGGKHGNLLSKQAQGVVFAIVEEALNNARKYSQATLIEVRFWQEDNLFVASVHDNGIGFDTFSVERDYSTRGSLGMVNMRERADRIDGSLSVESTPQSGTTVTLVVPLDKHGRRVQVFDTPPELPELPALPEPQVSGELELGGNQKVLRDTTSGEQESNSRA